MKVNQWIAFVDVYEMLQLKAYCTDEELFNIEQMLELEILTQIVDKYAPEPPNEAETLEIIAEVKRDFIIEYLSEAEDDDPDISGIAYTVEILLNSSDSTPEDLENALADFYKSESTLI